MILQKARKGTKERGILFRGEMVRAILDGRKTQTRRVIKPQPVRTDIGWVFDPDGLNRSWNDIPNNPYPGPSLATPALACECPHGKAGDRLWVRESWAPSHMASSEVLYRADPLSAPQPARWFPSIHMFRWASRITLEVLKVRVERVAEISVKDAIAEGIELAGRDTGDVITAFRKLWDTMRAGTEFAWDENPWVWVIEFKTTSVGALRPAKAGTPNL